MEQHENPPGKYRSRWIRLGIVPLHSESEVDGIEDKVLQSTTSALNQHGKVAGDEAELRKALEQYGEMLQHRESLAVDEYLHLVQRMNELTEEDEYPDTESECVVTENDVDYNDPYDADDEEELCEDEGAPSTRSNAPSSDGDCKNSRTKVEGATSEQSDSPNYSLANYFPWVEAKLVNRLMAPPTAGQLMFTKMDRVEYFAGPEGVVEKERFFTRGVLWGAKLDFAVQCRSHQ
ncbi:hypothetical protein IWX49DRAFT_601534 [Phyllosticta citricarpa]